MATSVTAESLEEMVRACVSDIAHLEVVDLTDSGCGDKVRELRLRVPGAPQGSRVQGRGNLMAHTKESTDPLTH